MHPAVNPSANYFIFPLGDSAITIDLGNHIDQQLNTKALALYDWLQEHRIQGVTDIIIAYSSVSVFYDLSLVPLDRGRVSRHNGDPSWNNGNASLGKEGRPDGVFYCLKRWLEKAWEETADSRRDHHSGRSIRIPVCYEPDYGPDLGWVAREKGLTPEEVIRLHGSQAYHVYMIGFLPGFSYMGKTDPRLEVSRKAQPVPVVAGGVGIAGAQTGIYPLNSPGGWQIIGRTPLKLFDPRTDPPVRLQAGDQVLFYPITGTEFAGWKDS
jgi:inhibitor of KinA